MNAPFRPGTEAELADLIRGANGPLSIAGGDTRRIGPAPMGTRLSTAALTGIDLYEPGALTLVARAGTPLAEIDAALAAERQRLAFEVPDLRALLGRDGTSTIGGVVAANASGPRRVQVGACRDALLGVRFVDGTGQVIKNGGRVMKNVTGYDLVKLLAGSNGTLGVLTEVSLKVQALPEAEVTLSRKGATSAQGLAAMTAALGSPFDVSGVAHLALSDTSETLIRIEGMAGSVAYRAQELIRRLEGDWQQLAALQSAEKWRAIRDVRPFVGRAGAVWRVAAKPSDAVDLAVGADEAILDCGGGRLWLLLPDTAEAGLSLRARVATKGGHATLIRGENGLPAFPPEAPGVAALTHAIRQKFDPRHILNQGIMG